MKPGLLFAALLTLPVVSMASDDQQMLKGRSVYQAVCAACHAPANVMVSAPKAGDLVDWGRRAPADRKGLEMLTNHAVEGFGAMPPKGGRAELTRAEIRAAIEFMRSPPKAAPGAEG
jgi:cytochrome c5